MADMYDYPEIYDERFTEAANTAYREHYRKLLDGCDIHDILDCSFGTGNLTFELCELGYNVWGSDISQSMLEQGAKKAATKGFDVPLVQADFRELSAHFDRTFDCVMSTGSALGHVDNAGVVKALTEMDKLVHTGGYLYLDTRNWDMELCNKKHIQFAHPYDRENGERIHMVQVWEYPPDGTIRINICQAYERDKKIYQQEIFEEVLTPFSIDLLTDTLTKLGYRDIVIKPLPYFHDMDFMDIPWYCLRAQKA